MKNYLFVGGTHDGEWITLPENHPPTYSLVKRFLPKGTPFYNKESQTFVIEKEEYHTHHLSGGNHVFEIMVSKEFEARDVLRSLLTHYHPNIAGDIV